MREPYLYQSRLKESVKDERKPDAPPLFILCPPLSPSPPPPLFFPFHRPPPLHHSRSLRGSVYSVQSVAS